MSIIYDALKKTEAMHDISQPKPLLSSDKLIPKVKKMRWFMIIIAAGLILMFTFPGIKREFLSSKKHNNRPSTFNRQGSFLKKSPVYIKKKYSLASYVLEGIIYDKKSSSAIINSKVLKESDSINNLKVYKIGPKDVQLIDPKTGAITTLSL